MTKKIKVQLGVIGVFLCLALVYFIGYLAGRSKQRHSKPTNASSQGVSVSTATEPEGDLYLRLRMETEDLIVERDPFHQPKQRFKQNTDHQFILMGITSERDNYTAIINDTIVEVGSEIDGYTVIDIKKDRVILSDENHHYEIQLSP